MKNIVACSDCFHDSGLKLEAQKIGINDNSVCPLCHSLSGKKLDKELLDHLCWKYFVEGSFYKTEYGGASILMVNDRGTDDAINCGKPLKQDIHFLLHDFNISVFYYAPPMWRIGMNDWLEDLNCRSKKRRLAAINKIIQRCKTSYLEKNTTIYRLRTDLEANYLSPLEYDSPPKQTYGNGRLNLKDDVVFYASFDIETCIHEGRATINDELYIATFRPRKQLKLLDATLIQHTKKEETPFEMLDVAISFIFTAGRVSYKNTRLLAQAIFEQGYDGIIYPSFFNQVREHDYKNIALFGKPVKENKLELIGINRVILKNVNYDISLGPAIE